MLELPELTPESFEILAVRELRKVGLEVSELRVHRRATLPEPERGYLLELKGVISRAPWQRRILIACRRQQVPIGRAAVESLRDHVSEAGREAATPAPRHPRGSSRRSTPTRRREGRAQGPTEIGKGAVHGRPGTAERCDGRAPGLGGRLQRPCTAGDPARLQGRGGRGPAAIEV